MSTVSADDGVALAMALFGCCCGDLFMIKKYDLFYDFSIRAGVTQKKLVTVPSKNSYFSGSNITKAQFLCKYPITIFWILSILLLVRYYANFLLAAFIWFFMSTKFGTCVGHSAKLNVLETQLESSNIAWHVKSLTNYRFSEVQVLHLLPNESD